MAHTPVKPARFVPDERFAPDPQPETSNADAPSQFKNNQSQINQPTGHGVSGGDLPPVGAAGNELAPNDRNQVSVTLNNNYVPLSDEYAIVSTPTPITGSGKKLVAGTRVWLPADEADVLVRDGRAVRDLAA